MAYRLDLVSVPIRGLFNLTARSIEPFIKKDV